jgi:hypothetical protein
MDWLQRELPELLAACPLPCIVTCRPTWEGCVACHFLAPARLLQNTAKARTVCADSH